MLARVGTLILTKWSILGDLTNWSMLGLGGVGGELMFNGCDLTTLSVPYR